MAGQMDETTERRDEGEDVVGIKSFPERQINYSTVIWQALAAVIDGKDDDEAKKRLQALSVEELRVFRFQIDRMRTLIYNVQRYKMNDIDLTARLEHEAEVRKPEEGAGK